MLIATNSLTTRVERTDSVLYDFAIVVIVDDFTETVHHSQQVYLQVFSILKAPTRIHENFKSKQTLVIFG